MVRAKFICHNISENGFNKTVNFHAVYSDKGENADFAKSTPSGSISMNIDSETKAAQVFEIGKAYYVDFKPVINEH